MTFMASGMRFVSLIIFLVMSLMPLRNTAAEELLAPLPESIPALAANTPAASSPASPATAPVTGITGAPQIPPMLPPTPDPASLVILEPGDVLFIGFPGEDDFNTTFRIDKEGNINLPEIGTLDLAGLTLADARTSIGERIQEMYRDVSRLSIELREKKLLINVLGFVRKPGMVAIDANGNIQTAIQKAGGLMQGAQLDKMQIQRGDSTLPFSYKEYLDTGDMGKLPPLKSMDTLFIPASPLMGNVQIDFDAKTLAASGDASDAKAALSVFGEVQNPGKFSYTKGLTVMDVLMRAGGVTRYGAVEQIKIINNGKPMTFNLKHYLEKGSEGLLPQVAPGSTVFVPLKESEIKTGSRVVYVMGEVFKQGAFENAPDATLLDILANAGGPTRFADSRSIRILRNDGTVIPFDLLAYTDGQGERAALPRVNAGDAVFVPEKIDEENGSWIKIPTSRSVRLMGGVKSPGRYEWSDEMTLIDLISHAGGPSEKADISAIRIIPLGKAGENVSPVLFDLETFIKKGGDVADIPPIHAGYTIVVPASPPESTTNKNQWLRQPSEKSIYVMGQVGSPGRYAFDDVMTFLDILSAADGPTGNADIHRVRVIHRNDTGARVTELDLGRYFETGDENLLPRVQQGDTIFVPEKDKPWIDTPKEESVRVLGAVGKPGRYEFRDDLSLLDLLAQAGGTTPSAMADKIVVVNHSCCEQQSSTFDLVSFVKAPDFTKLPVLRAGDTVYIPDRNDSHWKLFMDGVTDIFKIVSIVGIVGAL